MASPLSFERETAVQVAKMAEEAERYDDMVEEIKKVVMMQVNLTAEERRLVSAAYKNAVFARRVSWKKLSSIEKAVEAKGNMLKAKWVKEYRHKVEIEINDISSEAIFVAKELLLLPCTDSESRVFFHKMVGDHNRYIAEIMTDFDEQQQYSFQCFNAYEAAVATAESELPGSNPIRLAAALNYSVYYYEVMEFPKRACEVANKAFDDAILDLDNLSGESLIETMNMMQLLRDNVILWTAPDIVAEHTVDVGTSQAGPSQPTKDGGGGAAAAGQAGCSYVIIDD